MGEIVGIDALQPHVVRECLCARCGKRWIDVSPEGLWLKDMECPGCGEVGFVIGTGQELPEDGEVLS